MKLSKIFKSKAVLLILVVSILLGFVVNLFLTGIDYLIYPRKFDEFVEKYSEEYSVPSSLIYAVIKAESSFRTDAVSSAGAIGLMQLLPDTYSWLATDKLDEIPSAELLYQAETNIKYGVYYLQYLFAKFGSFERAVIAYNWGEGNFAAHLAENEYTEGDYSSIPVRETRNYVKKVMRYMEKYEKLY